MGTDRSWVSSGLGAAARCAAVAVLLVSLHGRFDGNSRVASAAEPAIVIEGARIWDGTGKAAIQDAVLVISGDRIQAVGPRGSVAVPAGAKTVPGQGKTLIPGLINLHGHVGMTRGLKAGRENYTKENVLAQLKQYARYGVTTVLSLGTDFEPMFEVRGPAKADEPARATVFTAGRGFTGKNGYPAVLPGNAGVPREVDTVDEARRNVRNWPGKEWTW